MKNIKKTKNNLFLIALMMSILFVPGILMIIFGFINHIIFIGVIGIIIVVIDFYGLPIVWMRFGEYNYYYRLFYQITVEKINYVTLLAQTNQRKKDKLLADIHFLIGKGYLTNYILKDNERLIDLIVAPHVKFPIIYIVVIIVAHYWIKKVLQNCSTFLFNIYIFSAIFICCILFWYNNC